MIPYAAYKVVHYTGIFLLLVVLAAALTRAAGPDRAGAGADGGDPWRRPLGAGHGFALFLVLLGGFGMLARLNVDHGSLLPGWVWAKLGIWGLLGAVIAARRRPRLAPWALLLAPVLAALAGWVALYKPL